VDAANVYGMKIIFRPGDVVRVETELYPDSEEDLLAMAMQVKQRGLTEKKSRTPSCREWEMVTDGPLPDTD